MWTNCFLLVDAHIYLRRLKNYNVELCSGLELGQNVKDFFSVDYMSRVKALSHQMQSHCSTWGFTFIIYVTGIDLISGESSQQNDRPGSSAGEGSKAVKEAGLRVITGQ